MIGLRDKDFLLPARGKTCSGSDLGGDVAGAVAAATIAAAAMTTNDSGLTSQQQEQQVAGRRRCSSARVFRSADVARSRVGTQNGHVLMISASPTPKFSSPAARS